MREVEVKILEIDKKAVVAQLKKWGAKKTFEGKMHATFYDFKDKALSKKGAQLRVRTKGEKVEFTYKDSLSQGKVKSLVEHEVVTNDVHTLKKILEGVGLREQRQVVKRRTSYAIGDVHFDIDEFGFIPTFMEIEGPGLKSIEKWVKKLGYSMQDAKPWTAKQLFAHYRQKAPGVEGL